MKIVFFIKSMRNAGGTERVTSLISGLLLNNHHEVSIITIDKYEKGFYSIPNDIRIISLAIAEKRKLCRITKTIKKLHQEIAIISPDIIITVDSLLSVYSLPVSKWHNIRHVCWEHFGYNITFGLKIRILARQINGIFSDDIVVLTDKDKIIWEEKLLVNKSNIRRIYNPSPYCIQNSEYDINSKIILSIGRLTKIKGLDLLITAWSIIAKDYPDWSVHIIGNGEEKSNLINLCSDLHVSNSVCFFDATPNLDNFYRESSIFCLPSRYEGFGLVLVEALCFGLPVISFNCEVGPEELLGEAGILVEKNNVVMLSENIAMLIKQNKFRSDLSKKSRDRAKEFTLNAICNEWELLLNNKHAQEHCK